MNMKSLCAFIIGALLAVSGLLWLKFSTPKKASIALFTTMSHSALDSVGTGFKAALSRGVEIIEFNAEGNVQQANLIARQIAQNPNIIGILAIGTLAAQSVAKVEKKKPIVVTAVTDPQVFLANSKSDNICGLSDSIDADYQVNTILELLAETKSIALLYSPHEANSAHMVKNLKLSAESKNIKINLVGVHEPQQIASASIKACTSSDVLLVPLDNQLVAAMPVVIKATKNLPCAIISSNESPIYQGASIAFGVDYEQSGRQAGLLMNSILASQKSARDIGFINPSDIGLYLNQRVIRDKDIKINFAVQAKIIDGE